MSIVTEANKALYELRDTAKRMKSGTAETKERLDRINSVIDKLSDQNQRIYAEKKALEQKVNDMEKTLYRPGAFAQGPAQGKSQELKSFMQFCQGDLKS